VRALLEAVPNLKASLDFTPMLPDQEQATADADPFASLRDDKQKGCRMINKKAAG
jgi:hypothetical protein